jgi:hypothetical protein
MADEARFVWIPEAPKFPGTYATGERSESKNCTLSPHAALQFETREACDQWCQENPHPAFEPRQHGFG